jgi:hypothetical protein
MRFHKNSIANALVDLFPDVQFDKSKLLSIYLSRSSLSLHLRYPLLCLALSPPLSLLLNFLIPFLGAYFSSVRRQFFESFAETNGFDPTDVDQWYTYTTESIMNVEVLPFYL